jgi:flagellar hook-length control protein FliK
MQNILPVTTELKGKLSLDKESGARASAEGSFALELGRLGKEALQGVEPVTGAKTAIVAAPAVTNDADDVAITSTDDWLALVEKARAGDANDIENLQQALENLEEDGGLADLVKDMKNQLSDVLRELQALVDEPTALAGSTTAGDQQNSEDRQAHAFPAETLEVPEGTQLPDAETTTNISDITSQASALTEALIVLTQKQGAPDRDGTKPVMGFEPLQQTLQKQVQVLDALDAELKSEGAAVVKALPQTVSDLVASLQELGVEAASEEDSASSLQTLLGELTALLEEGDAGALVAINGAELKDKLSKLLDTMEWQGEPLSSGDKREVLALLQAQLDSIAATDKPSQATQATANLKAEPQQAAIQQLLAQLNNVLESEQSDVRVTQPEARSGNVLPPVLQALAKATEQLRNEAQAGAVAAAAEGAAEDDSQLAMDGFRRLFNELTGSQGSGDSKTNAPQNPLAANSNQPQPIAAREGVAAAQVRNAQEAAQTPHESARQLQQAIDILGPQAPNQLRERISVMFNSRTQAAEIRLDPPDLGRMQIRVNLNQEQASVNFQVSSPQAREALEQSMPRLRELLAENGIQLADSNVSEQKSGGDGRTGTGGEGFAGGTSAEGVEAELTEQAMVEAPVTHADGRIDYYA